MFSFKKRQDGRAYRQSGQMLIESIISISIAVVGLLGILTLLSRSISLNRNVTSNFVATYLAAEGIEVVKNIIDTSYVNNSNTWKPNLITDGDYRVAYDTATKSLLSPSSDPLFFNDLTGIYDYTNTGQATGFKRTIQITNISSDEIKVNAIVRWTDKGEAREVILEDHFFNWRTP